MKAADDDGELTVEDVVQRIREPAQEDATHAPIDEQVTFWVTLYQIESRLHCLPEIARDVRATLPIPSLCFSEIRFSFGGKTNVHSSRSSLVRTSSHELSRGR